MIDTFPHFSVDGTEEKERQEEEQKALEPVEEQEEEEIDELKDPLWINDPGLGSGPKGQLNTSEIEFFQVNDQPCCHQVTTLPGTIFVQSAENEGSRQNFAGILRVC